MSKAFTREDDENEDDKESADSPSPLPAGSKNCMTPQGESKLREEFKHLLYTARPKIVETVAWAASLGDRSENADYIYGKRRLREIDRRIRFLVQRLDIAQVVDPEGRANADNGDQIFFGATVTVQNQDGEQRT